MGIVLMKFPGVNAAGLLPAFTDHWARLRQDEETERQYERENSANLGRGIRGAGQAIAGGITDWKDKRYNEQQAAKRAEADAAKTAEQREYDDLVRAQTVQRRRGAATGPTMIGAGDPQPAPTTRPATTQPAAQQVVPPSKQPAIFQRQQPVPQQQVSLVPNQPASLPGQPGASQAYPPRVGEAYRYPPGFERGRGDVDFINDTDLTIRQKQHWKGFENEHQAIFEAENLTTQQRDEQMMKLYTKYGAGRPIVRKPPQSPQQQWDAAGITVQGIKYHSVKGKLIRDDGEFWDEYNKDLDKVAEVLGRQTRSVPDAATGGQREVPAYGTAEELYKAAESILQARGAYKPYFDAKQQQAQQAAQQKQQRQAQATGRPSGTPPLPPQQPGGRPSTPNPANMRGLPGQPPPPTAAQAMAGPAPKVPKPGRSPANQPTPKISDLPAEVRPMARAQKAVQEAMAKIQKIKDEALMAGRKLNKGDIEKIQREEKKIEKIKIGLATDQVKKQVTKEMEPLLKKIMKLWNNDIRPTYNGKYLQSGQKMIDSLPQLIQGQNADGLRKMLMAFQAMKKEIKGKSR